MPEIKINNNKMLAMVAEGMSHAKIGEYFGVSRQAVSKRLKEVRGRTTKVIATRKIAEVVDKKIDAIKQLQKINADANEILDLLMRWGRGDEEALQVIESQVLTKKVRVGNEEIDVQEFKLKDPRELALKAMSEIRGQLKLQLEIFQTLYSLQAAEEFQNAVLETLAEVSPDVRSRVIQKLNQKRSVRSAVRFH